MDARVNLFSVALVIACWCGASPVYAQLYFEGEAIFLGRNNDGGGTILQGDDQSFSNSGGSYNFEPGYRLGAGLVGDRYQIDFVFTQLTPWTTGQSSTINGNVYFDNDTPHNADDLELVFPGFLRAASTSSLSGADESTEGEFLASGSTFSTYTESNYRDFEVNFGTSQNYRTWRLGVGYRNIQLDEKTNTLISGDFDVTPVGIGIVNSGLSHTALINAGATLISGTGDGFDAASSPAGPDIVTSQMYGSAQNDLNGAQAIFSWRFYDGSWITLEAIGKAGIFQNRARGTIQETVVGSGNDDSVYQRTFTDNDTAAAFAGNVGLRAVIALTDYIDLVGGYEVLFLSGVALGQDQVNGVKTDTAGTTYYQVQHDGSIIANGANVGFRIYW